MSEEEWIVKQNLAAVWEVIVSELVRCGVTEEGFTNYLLKMKGNYK